MLQSSFSKQQVAKSSSPGRYAPSKELWAILLHGEASRGHCIEDEDQRKLLKYLSRRKKNYPTHVKHQDFICLLKISSPLKIVFSVLPLTCSQLALQLVPQGILTLVPQLHPTPETLLRTSSETGKPHSSLNSLLAFIYDTLGTTPVVDLNFNLNFTACWFL